MVFAAFKRLLLGIYKYNVRMWFVNDAKILLPTHDPCNFKTFIHCVEFLMACSRRDFHNARWWWWRWWYNHVFNCTNMILNFNKRLLWIFKTTFCSSYRLHIETRFHFNWNIYPMCMHREKSHKKNDRREEKKPKKLN